MSRRVVNFSTGNVGVHALRTLIERPNLELVGVHAVSPDKIGRDAADLCGPTTPTGVIATDDTGTLDDIVRFLRAGTDHNQGGVIATAARAVNAIEAVCDAPAGILAAHHLRPLDHTRGVMW